MRCHFNPVLIVAFLVISFLSACIKPPEGPPVKEPEGPPSAKVKVSPFLKVGWEDLQGWEGQNFLSVFNSFQRSCRTLKNRPLWKNVCEKSDSVGVKDGHEAKDFFESNFQPYQVRNRDGSVTGIMTGYYAPDLKGSRKFSDGFRYPLYRKPKDLLTIDLDDVYPQLKNMRLRGRVKGGKVIPYWSRAAIDGSLNPLKGEELCWVEDPVELFFLHIQGSGRIHFGDGKSTLVGYAGQNGHPFRSIGKLFHESKEMTPDQMSMQNIRAWAQKNPRKARKLLDENPSYIFFHELPSDWMAPPGALGIPLTPRYSLAVDAKVIPLGSPVFVATTWPATDFPLNRLMLAQDTGGAIKGPVRGDFFWGMGKEAEKFAGRMKQDVRFWALLPR